MVKWLKRKHFCKKVQFSKLQSFWWANKKVEFAYFAWAKYLIVDKITRFDFLIFQFLTRDHGHDLRKDIKILEKQRTFLFLTYQSRLSLWQSFWKINEYDNTFLTNYFFRSFICCFNISILCLCPDTFSKQDTSMPSTSPKVSSFPVTIILRFQ